jgi:segregation and condensation protein A
MADYRVNLDVFAGPLDLLLYLVHKEEVDIYDISIAHITEQYIRYIEMLKNLNIDLAGDFLIMAATLMQIKSASLLPMAEVDGIETDDTANPRAELIRQLLEYKKFKDAANMLSTAADDQSLRFARPAAFVEQLTNNDNEPMVDIDQLSLWGLLEAFDSIIQATGGAVDISHIKDDTPIDLYQIEILHRLQSEGAMSFERIFESRKNRLEIAGLFLALLELVREKLVWAEQQQATGAIYLRPLTNEPAEQAVQKAIQAAAESLEQDRTNEAQSHPQSSVKIVEIPAGNQAVEPVITKKEQKTPIPIPQLPAKSRAAFSKRQPKEQQSELDGKD